MSAAPGVEAAATDPGETEPRHAARFAWAAVIGWSGWWVVRQAADAPAAAPQPDADIPTWLSWLDLGLRAAGLFAVVLAVRAIVGRRAGPRIRPSRRDANALAGAAGALLFGDIALFTCPEFVGSPFRGYVANDLLLLAVFVPPALWVLNRGASLRRALVAWGVAARHRWRADVGLGVAAYAAYLLMLAWLDRFLPPGPAPLHWAEVLLRDSSGVLLVWMSISTIVITPVVEELTFRGILHRFLRDECRDLRPLVAAAVASVVSAWLFAICHLQGWGAIPGLMLFGITASVLREWRRSLVAPMVLHGMCWLHILVIARAMR